MTTQTRTRPIWQDYIIPATEEEMVRGCDVTPIGLTDVPAANCDGSDTKWVVVVALDSKTEQDNTETQTVPVANPDFNPADEPFWGEFEAIDEFRYLDHEGVVVATKDKIEFGETYTNDADWTDYKVDAAPSHQKMTTETRTRPVWQDYVIPSTEQKYVRECDTIINGPADDPAPSCDGDNFKWVEIETYDIKIEKVDTQSDSRPVENPDYIDGADIATFGEWTPTEERRFKDRDGNIVEDGNTSYLLW